MKPLRFPYTRSEVGHTAASELPYLPIRLSTPSAALNLSGLLDTGSTVNVLPYAVGLELGLLWNQQMAPISLAGNLALWPAFGVIVTAQVATLPPVEMAFAWTQAQDAPLVLGQINFFMEFDVCFFRAQSVFEVTTKSTA